MQFKQKVVVWTVNMCCIYLHLKCSSHTYCTTFLMLYSYFIVEHCVFFTKVSTVSAIPLWWTFFCIESSDTILNFDRIALICIRVVAIQLFRQEEEINISYWPWLTVPLSRHMSRVPSSAGIFCIAITL